MSLYYIAGTKQELDQHMADIKKFANIVRTRLKGEIFYLIAASKCIVDRLLSITNMDK